MSRQLTDLAVRRGRLIERIAFQRADLGRRAQPVQRALYGADRALAAVRKGSDYVRSHPGIVGSFVATFVAALAVLKPRRVWRWGRRGFVAWRTWTALRGKVASLAQGSWRS
ncbi:MAG: hypothetical protein HY777_14270 [Betaproteobacteria bacterium]|nr:hypothetical protein [Betaproteobacteria bacterium]